MPPERSAASGGARAAEVWACLALVMDPELDRSVTEMGFIERVEVDAGAVAVEFRLPTFWCAANFAFLMAHDMKAALAALPWVTAATVRLRDHFAAARINAGLAQDRSFAATFGSEAGGDLDGLRRTFLEKAFLRRQLAVLDWLKETARLELDVLADLPLGALRRHGRADGGSPIARYLTIREAIHGAAADAAPAFVTLAGAPLAAGAMVGHVRTARRVAHSAEANAEMCRLYLEARRSHPVPASDA